VFANSYLVGTDPYANSGGVQRNELELFKQQLLQKINARLYVNERDTDSLIEKETLLGT
jgi:hypothetical protein